MIECADYFARIDEEGISKIVTARKTSPFHCPKAIHSRWASLPRGDFAVYRFQSPDQLVVSAFERMNGHSWRCFFLSDPFLSSRPMNNDERLLFMERIVRHLDADGLYFPLVDYRSDALAFFISGCGGLSLRRLPSPYMHWQIGEQTFIDRIHDLSKKRAHRFWKKFDSRLTLKERTGIEALQALDAIEKTSWKFKSAQSMHHRENQFAFYGGWLEKGGLFLHLAEDHGKPVAYRLDAAIGRTVYALKYSYDEEYRQCSPGYYLLTQGLHARWSGNSIETIDLWGSPDLLKNSIKSGEYERYDFYWPATKAGQQILDEKRLHDQKLQDSVNDAKGLKSIFL